MLRKRVETAVGERDVLARKLSQLLARTTRSPPSRVEVSLLFVWFMNHLEVLSIKRASSLLFAGDPVVGSYVPSLQGKD